MNTYTNLNAYQNNREKLNAAYQTEREAGHPWHQIAIYLKEAHTTLDGVLDDDEMTDELIRRLPELRTEDKFTYKGHGSMMESEAAAAKAQFYTSKEWKDMKQYVYDHTPSVGGMPSIRTCAYCHHIIDEEDPSSWTIHHKLFLDDDVEKYKNDKDVRHYSIMHCQCHHKCHDILKESKDKDEIKQLTNVMGDEWIRVSLSRFLDN